MKPYQKKASVKVKPSEKELYFGTEGIWNILLRIAPPVMFAQLVQALYNIVDSFFVGQFSSHALTALSVIAPVQMVITAIAVGTGIGVNTLMSRRIAENKPEMADKAAGVGMVLAICSWAVFTLLSVLLLPSYIRISTNALQAAEYAVIYGFIVCIGSIGIFLESCWTKAYQARGNMRLPMIAQIAGAVTNIVLDPLFLFTFNMGIAGAAVATVIGQLTAAVIVGIGGFKNPPVFSECIPVAKEIYRLGYPSIFFNFYILSMLWFSM